jgi:hypothetical protein
MQIKSKSKRSTYLNDKSSFAEAIGQCFLLDFFPRSLQQIESIQQIEFKVDLIVNGVDSAAQQKSAVMNLEIFDDALVHRLKSLEIQALRLLKLT